MLWKKIVRVISSYALTCSTIYFCNEKTFGHAGLCVFIRLFFPWSLIFEISDFQTCHPFAVMMVRNKFGNQYSQSR